MADAEILARDVELPPGRNGMIRHALERIGRSGNGWHGSVETIEITRVIDAGRSGAVVIEVALRAGAEYRQRVVKVGPAAEMATEYTRFQHYLSQYPATVCAPVQEATPGAVDPAAQQDGVVEAVAYMHVADYAGRPRTPPPTLEDLVRAAFDDPAQVRAARQMIEQLFTQMSMPFHNRRRPVREARSLRDLNPSLGPDLVLDPAPAQADPVYADDVLEASLGVGEFPVGREVRVADSGGNEIRVETPAGEACLAGRVVRTRFTEQRRRFDGAFETIDRAGGSVVADGVRTADPAGGLRPALTDPRFGRIRGVVHGDLNARNVMCVENQPILIDFAMTADDQPVLSDAAWLEISLLRDVFAGLPYADLVRLQRFLALATRFRPHVTDVAELEATFDGLLEGKAAAAFRILLEVRTRAQHALPDAGAWLDHLVQLHLSAYRTVKWDTQPPGALRAAHAAAAVATEWLATGDPYAHWSDLPELLRRLSPIVDLTRPDAVTAVTELLTAVDARQPGIETAGVDELRERFVRTRYLEQARELIVELSHEHGTFLETQPVPHGETTVLAGGPGAGKSRLLRELAYRGALDIAGPGPAVRPLRVPILVTAGELPSDLPRETLVLGAACILLDGLDEVTGNERDRISGWCRSLLERFPRVRLAVSVRNRTWAEGALGIPVTQLEPWGAREITRFLDRFPVTEQVRRELKEKILDVHPQAPPGFVAMVAETATARRPLSINEVYDEYFAGDLTGEAVATLGSLATAAVDRGEPVPCAVDVSAFFDHGILEPDAGGVRFCRLAVRDFFAARAFGTTADSVPQRVRAFAWRDVCLLAARLPSTPAAVVDLMVRTVRTADPRYAARLVAFRPAMVLDHVAAWKAVLADPDAGSYAHRVTAEALLLTSAPPARQALGDVLIGSTTPAPTQLDILGVLEAHALRNRGDRTIRHWLQQVLGAILTGDHPDGTRIAAIAVIHVWDIRGLEVLLADLLRSAGPAVAGAADDLLSVFGVLVPPHLAEVRSALTAARLADLEARLPSLSGAADIRTAIEQRIHLLERIGSGPELLRRRFSFGIGYEVRDLLEEAGGSPGIPAGVTAPAERSEPEALALAHRVLSEPHGSTEDRDELVLSARPDSPLHVLLIAAAAVSSPSAADHAADLVEQLAPIVEADRIEGLAALGQAVAHADWRRGFVVTRRAARVLRERDLAARRHWSWMMMLARTSPEFEQLDLLLAEGAEGALEELARYAPCWDGMFRPGPRLGARAREFVLGKRQDESEWALAVAAAGLTETLSQVVEIAGNRSLATVVETLSTGRYGIVEMALHARVLTALSGLARQSGKPDEAHRVLDEFDAGGLHPSVEAGRVVGLAHLGDWEPLLRVAPGDGSLLDSAAHQAIRGWVPGPCTPEGLRDPADVAARLLRLLEEPGLPPGRRSLLEELIFAAEQKSGTLLAR